MATKRGTNPKSHEALRKSVASRKKDAKQVHVTLSPEAIDEWTQAAEELGISRSELIERLGRKGKDWLIKEGMMEVEGSNEL